MDGATVIPARYLPVTMSSASYRHTQYGWIAVPAVLGVVVVLATMPPGARDRVGLWVVMALLAAATMTFSRLTIAVEDTTLRWAFGWGLPRWQVPIADVVAVEPSGSSWLEGWGIRLTSRGLLYNVSGFQAVEVTLRSGKRFRLGTDEPDDLVRVLRARIAP